MRCGENSTILDLLRARAEHAPEAVAIGAPGRRSLTYGELLGQVERVVEFLNVRGIHRNDRIAVVLPNGPEMAAVFLGVAAGAVCAPLNPAYSRGEFAFYLSDLNPKALIVQSGMISAAIAVAELRGESVIAEEITDTLTEIETLSDEETQGLLVKERVAGGNGNAG